MEPLNNFNKIKNVDCLLLAGGSDHRAYEILRKCSDNNLSVNKILLFNFHERTDNLKRSDKYFDFEKTRFKNIELIDCTIKDPISCYSKLQQNLSIFQNSNSIAIDISCFTKPYFFYLLKYFNERLNIVDLTVFYTEPYSYRFPKKGLFSSYRETEGPIEILSIPGFNGIEERGGLKILIVQLGFEAISLDEIIIDFSPNESFFINGFPSYTPKFKDFSLVINQYYTGNKDSFILYSRANNPFEVFNLLEKIKKNYNNAFLNVAPLGTKPMALGACMFAIHYPEVKVVFPFSLKYERITTEQCWYSWVYRIPLKFD